MQRGDPKIQCKMAVYNRYIRKANYPLWICFQPVKLQLVNCSHSSISPSCTHNRLHFVVIDHFLEVYQSFLVSSAKCEISFADGCPNFDPVSPAFHKSNGGFDRIIRDKTGGTGDADHIPRF